MEVEGAVRPRGIRSWRARFTEMQLRYDEDFIEAAVFVCANGRRPGVSALQVARFHRQREKLYLILDPDERSAAFFHLHLAWFREWGLEEMLMRLVEDFPLLCGELDVLAVRKARGKTDEGAELYVGERGVKNAILALRPEAFAGGNGVTDYVRHEFMHLNDMVDPAFGYEPELQLPRLNPAQQRIARERYRLLWDISIDGRLQGAGHKPVATREQHFQAFARAYAFWPVERRDEVFEQLWSSRTPKHWELVSLIADPRGLREARRPEPGGSCPLCDFPTFQWADSSALRPELLERIRSEFPLWTVEQGLCGRCLETYEAIAHA